MITLRRALVVAAPLAIVGTLLAQALPGGGPSTPIAAAHEALNRGDYDDVAGILANERDAQAVALIARADIERGRYAEAEQRLRGPAQAQPTSDAALELGLLQLQLGRRADARRTLEGVLRLNRPATAADFLRLARAARALGNSTSNSDLLHDANAYFRDANRAAANDPIVNTGWGELFLDKGEAAEAQKSFEIALAADPDNVAARIGMAHLLITQNPPAAKEAIDAALETNPRYVPAHLLAAETALDDRNRDEATASIDKALETNPRSLEALSLRAAVAYLEMREQDFEQQARAVLEINPTYGNVYRVAGDHAARNYLFDEAVALTRRALSVDPDNTAAYADLGMHLLRTGDEAEARRALETAFERDPFNSSVVTKNLLTMLDEVDTFETITDGKLVMRFHPNEVGVMREYALPLAKEALAELERRYQFETRGPILIEMFPRHDDFAVRTLGLPGMIGALGACFGQVVTLDSPRARPPGDFNWGETLWHEMAHVLTLQMSNNRVPRWLSEGASVFEERRARPNWGREMDVPFAQALEQGRILKLADLNEGFNDPRMISLAYYQSSLVVEHIVERFGEPAYLDFVRSYGRGLETDEAVKEVLGVELDDLQASFDGALERRYAPLRAALARPDAAQTESLEVMKAMGAANPGSFAVQMQLGLALREAKEFDAAIAAFERAAALVPWATGDSNPHRLVAAVATEKGDTARAIEALEAVVRIDHSDVESARRLAGLVAPLGDRARAEAAWRNVVAIDPFDGQAQAALGRLALQRRDTETALRAFRSALATNPADRATAYVDLAEAYLQAGQVGQARSQIIAALEIAPSFERAQDLLLKIVDAGV